MQIQIRKKNNILINQRKHVFASIPLTLYKLHLCIFYNISSYWILHFTYNSCQFYFTSIITLQVNLFLQDQKTLIFLIIHNIYF